jgi:putative ABC transport system ATP-binding protein
MNLNLAVNLKKISKTYFDGINKVAALRDVDLDVRTGELLMLAGPSGCGKTTLISVIAGILNPDVGGECYVLGSELLKLNATQKTAFRAQNIGFVFQAFNLLPTLTAVENIAIPLIIQNMKRKEATDKAYDLLKNMDLTEKANSLPSSLSGGQQQRVAIARALIHNPKLIVCDEPTSALDGETGRKIVQLMKDMVLSQNRSLIIVTHDTRIFPYADRIAFMADGMIQQVANSYEEAKDILR